MKKLTLLIALVFILQATATSQPCLPQGITFRIQAQIDNFQTNHPNCTEIEGDVQIGEWGGGSDILNLYALNVITSIGGYLSIEYNPGLSSLAGLSSLTNIGGGLSLKYNGLINLTGLNNVDSVGNNIRIYGNDSLSSLTGLESITSVEGNLRIGIMNTAGNPSLVNLSGLENITSIEGLLTIHQNDVLSSLTGLENLDSIGALWIYGNDLTTLSGLDNVTSIGGGISIDEYHLTNLEALANITSIGGGLHLGGAWGSYINLTSLTGLDNVLSIGGDLRIMNLDSLTSLTGLENMSSIGGNLQIWDNDALTTLSGLDNLDSIGENLEIGWHYYWPRGNPSLSSLEELGNLTTIGGDIIIIYNDTLSYCEVQSICDYLANPNGSISIYNNAPGCNSKEEVEEACETVFIYEAGMVNKIIISPNPFSTSTTLEFELTQPGKVELRIYNQLGELIEAVQKNAQPGKQTFTWDAKDLPSGIYFIRIQNENELITRKMIKLK